MSKELLGTALVKRLCPVCLKQEDSEILMNTVLTEKNAEEVKKLHGKVVGFSDKCCDECKEKLPPEKGSWFIVVDSEKTEDLNNPYRTGSIFGVSKDYATKVGINSYLAYIDVKDAIKLNFPIK